MRNTEYRDSIRSGQQRQHFAFALICTVCRLSYLPLRQFEITAPAKTPPIRLTASQRGVTVTEELMMFKHGGYLWGIDPYPAFIVQRRGKPAWGGPITWLRAQQLSTVFSFCRPKRGAVRKQI